MTKIARIAKRIGPACALALCLAAGAAAHAASQWRITQLFSSADGTVQFIELTALASGQQLIGGRVVTSSQGATTRSYTIPTDLPGDSATVMYDGYYGTTTTYKSFVIGTQGFAALHVVTPDYTVPNGFLFTTNGTVNWDTSSDVFTYASLPTDGTHALNRNNGATVTNLAQNFAGDTGSVTVAASTAVALENPQPGSFQSGVGLISGWSCQGPAIAVTVDGGPQLTTPYGSSRADTAGPCGATNTNTGFGLLINYNLFGAGSHSAQLYVNGVQRGSPTQFTVTAPGGEFLSGASKQMTLTDFPSPGKTTVLVWQESQQNFAIKSVTP